MLTVALPARSPRRGPDVYSVRRLAPEDWRLHRELRLAALADAPGLLGGRLDEALMWGEREWRTRTTPEGGAIWAFVAGGGPAAVTAAYRDPEDPSGETAYFGYSWIAPAHRGRGLADRLHAVRRTWARNETGYARAATSLRRGNVPSQRAVLRAGFRFERATLERWHDGALDLELHYGLDLAALRSPVVDRLRH